MIPSTFVTSLLFSWVTCGDLNLLMCVVGEASYNSTITLHIEELPVTVDILGKSTCTSPNLPPKVPRSILLSQYTNLYTKMISRSSGQELRPPDLQPRAGSLGRGYH